jgi:hypothetical protein
MILPLECRLELMILLFAARPQRGAHGCLFLKNTCGAQQRDEASPQ